MDVDKAGNGHTSTLRVCFWILWVVSTVDVIGVIYGKVFRHPRLEGDTGVLNQSVDFVNEASPQQAAGYQEENLIVMRNHGFSNSSL